MGRALSRTDAAILGMLTVEPMTGYDMKSFCDQSLVHFWHENYGNLYPRLKKLQAAGLIQGRRERRDRAPDATVYRLTAAGRRRFVAWLRRDPETEHVRSELMLKFFFGSHVEPELSSARIRAYREEQLVTRDNFAAIEQMLRAAAADRPEAAFWLMALRRGQLLTEARLRWCDEAEACLVALAKERKP